MSISKTIEADKHAYYQALKAAQSSLDVTAWMAYFIKVVLGAQRDSKALVGFLLEKVKFFDTYKNHMEGRHAKVIGKMFDEGPEGFQGGMSAKKYMSITQVSKATATRDLQYLHEHGLLIKSGVQEGQ